MSKPCETYDTLLGQYLHSASYVHRKLEDRSVQGKELLHWVRVPARSVGTLTETRSRTWVSGRGGCNGEMIGSWESCAMAVGAPVGNRARLPNAFPQVAEEVEEEESF